MASSVATNASASLFGDAKVRKLLHSIEALVVTLTADGKIDDCNTTCQTISGFRLTELIGRNVTNAFAAAEEIALMQEKIDQMAAGEAVDRFDTFLLTKQGERKRIRWSGVVLDTPDEPKPALLLTGIDVSREFDAVGQLSKSEATTAKLQLKLMRLSEKYHDTGGIDIDRRSERRLSYPRRQRIAPLKDGVLPREDQFFVVECRNIGARGFGFFMDHPPGAREYVAELGNPAHSLYLTVEVKHATLARSADRDRYLVGCQYIGRVTS